MYSNAYITTTEFSFNNATQRTKNIFCGFSDIVVTDCTFKGQAYSNAN